MNAVSSRYGKLFRATSARFMLAGLLGAALSGPAFAAGKVHTVTIEQMKFAPESLDAAVGDTVVWKNKDVVPHNATASNGGFKSPTIAPGGSWKYKLRKKGAFPYTCTLHPTMKAALNVK
jgi:plastocyanin